MNKLEMGASRDIDRQALDVNKSGVWATRAREEIEAMTEMPKALKVDILKSLDTPQFGKYHNEGLRMGSHIGLMMERIDEIMKDSFDFATTGLPEKYHQDARDIVRCSLLRQGKAQMKRYAALHDVKKQDCMSVSFEDGRPDEIFGMDDWDQLVVEAAGDEDHIRKILQKRGIQKIGYRQDNSLTGTKNKEHGQEAIAYLGDLARSDSEVADFVRDNALIMKGVANHEMHFQVFDTARSAKQYFEKLLKSDEDKTDTPKFTDEEIDFMYAACFIDIVASLQENGSGDYRGFKNMLEARRCYQRVQEFKESQKKAGKVLNSNNLAQLMRADGFDKLTEVIVGLEKKSSAPSALNEEQLVLILRQLDELLKQADIDASKKAEIEEILRGEHYIKFLGQRGYGRLAGAIRTLLASVST